MFQSSSIMYKCEALAYFTQDRRSSVEEQGLSLSRQLLSSRRQAHMSKRWHQRHFLFNDLSSHCIFHRVCQIFFCTLAKVELVHSILWAEALEVGGEEIREMGSQNLCKGISFSWFHSSMQVASHVPHSRGALCLETARQRGVR